MFYFGLFMLLWGLACLYLANKLLEETRRNREKSEQAVARAHFFLDEASRTHEETIDAIMQARRNDEDDADWWKKERKAP